MSQLPKKKGKWKEKNCKVTLKWNKVVKYYKRLMILVDVDIRI